MVEFSHIIAAARIDCKLDLDVPTFADALWLAKQMIRARTGEHASISAETDANNTRRVDDTPAERQKDEIKLPAVSSPAAPTVPITTTESVAGGMSGLPISIPSASPLPRALDISRALRPLRRRVPSPVGYAVDEEETAQRIAADRIWLPVIHPVTERWLDVALLIDDSTSMALWHGTAKALEGILRTSSAFRTTRVYHLDSESNPVDLFPGHPWSKLQRQPIRAKSLVDPNHRRLFLVFTDAISDGWRRGRVAELLAPLSATGMISLLSPLPDRLWPRTTLGSFEQTTLRYPRVAPLGPIRFVFDESPQTGVVPMPIVSLDPQTLRPWARFFGRYSQQWPLAYLLPEVSAIKTEIATSDLEEEIDPEDRVDEFWMSSSAPARRLACLLATSPEISRPVSRLIRETMVRDATLAHEAEVFLGGLLKVVRGDPRAEPDKALYDFYPGIRDLLHEAAPGADARRVLLAVGAYIERNHGKLRGFNAVVSGQQDGPIELEQDENGFAEISLELLKRLGGDYARMADRVKLVPSARSGPLENEADIADTPSRKHIDAGRVVGGTTLIPLSQIDIGRLAAATNRVFGREDELKWLDACWEDRVKVASIVGVGGIGKSALVNAWLRGMVADVFRGAERVFGWSFREYGTSIEDSSDAFFNAALTMFGDPEPMRGSPSDKGDRLAKLTREKRTLLVLDGLESMQRGQGKRAEEFKDVAIKTLVNELVANNNGLLLITSRLGLRDFRGLPVAKVRAMALKHLSTEAGVELLRSCGVKGVESELRDAVKHYNGNALSLNLVASYLEGVAGGDIRRRLEIGPPEFDEKLAGRASRSVTAYEPWLGDQARSIWRMLGLFDRPAEGGEIASLRMAPPIPGLTDTLVEMGPSDWHKAVAPLERLGLIKGRYGDQIDTDPVVRRQFSEQLRREHPEAWREGHRRLYEYLRSFTQPFPSTLKEMEPLYAAVVQGCLAGKHEEALYEVWFKRIRRGNEHYGVPDADTAGAERATLAAFFDPPWKRITAELSEWAHSYLLDEARFVLRASGRFDDVANLHRLGLERAIAWSDWKDAASNGAILSDLLLLRGELQQAVEVARQTVEIADKARNAFQRASAKAGLGTVLHALGNSEAAMALFIEAETIQRESESAYPLLHDVHGFHYCDLLLELGRNVDVLKRAKQTLQWVKEDQWERGIALDHISLGRAYLTHLQRGGDPYLRETTSHLEKAFEWLRGTGKQELLPLGLLPRADLHIHRRAFPDARRDLDEAMAIATRCGFRLHECDVHLGYARLAIAEGNATEGRSHLEKARAIVTATGYHRRDRDIAELERITAPLERNTRRQLYESLCTLRADDLERFIVMLGIPNANLPSRYAPRAEHVASLLRWADGQDPIVNVELLYRKMLDQTLRGTPKRTSAPTSRGHSEQRHISSEPRFSKVDLSDALVVLLEPYDAELARYLANEARLMVVGPSDNLSDLVEVRIGLSEDAHWWVGDDVFGPEDPLIRIPVGDHLGLVRALLHYSRYNLPLRLAKRSQQDEGALRLQVLDARECGQLERSELDNPPLPSAALDDVNDSWYRLDDGAQVCFTVENRFSFPIYANLFNCATSGKVEMLGPTSLEVGANQRQTFWLRGRIGEPFLCHTSRGRTSNVDRLVVVGMTSPGVDLDYLRVNETFADAGKQTMRDVLRRGGDELRAEWTATGATVRIVKRTPDKRG